MAGLPNSWRLKDIVWNYALVCPFISSGQLTSAYHPAAAKAADINIFIVIKKRIYYKHN